MAGAARKVLPLRSGPSGYHYDDGCAAPSGEDGEAYLASCNPGVRRSEDVVKPIRGWDAPVVADDPGHNAGTGIATETRP